MTSDNDHFIPSSMKISSLYYYILAMMDVDSTPIYHEPNLFFLI